MPNNNDRGNGHEKNSLSDQGRSAGIGKVPDFDADEFDSATEGAAERAQEKVEAMRAQRLAEDERKKEEAAQIRRETSEVGIVSNGFEEAKAELEAMKARRAAESDETARSTAELRKEIDIVKRAKKLFAAQQIQFKDVKRVRQYDAFITQPLMTDENKLVVLNALFEGERDKPHRDHYRGRIVDHEGFVIDDHYPVVRWLEAFSAGGLKGVHAKGAREILKEYALADERNDLIDFVIGRIPKWDGNDRMQTTLIEMFEFGGEDGSLATDEDRNFEQYFWLSLYARVMMPGSLAPIVLSMFGAQGCGKSRLTKTICRIITGDPEADTVQLNLDGERLDFLRAITGNSIIASVGEMSGFTRADLNKTKDFITREADQLHYKFEGTFQQPRQWITVMDGNRYEGLQRDDSGNRRFRPMFCGQLPIENGQRRWKSDFVVKQKYWDTFEEDVWQIMAECAKWFDDNGESGYQKYVAKVVLEVQAFNAVEREHDSGTTRDPDIETYLTDAILAAPKRTITKRDGSGIKGVVISLADLVTEMRRLTGNSKTNHDRIRLAVCARGAVVNPIHNKPTFFFAGHESIDAFETFVRGGDSGLSVIETSDRKTEKERRDEEF